MRVEDLLAPLAVDRFMADHYGRLPLHLAPSGREIGAVPLDWEGFNRLLGIRPHWTAENLKLILDGKAIDEDFFLEEVRTPAGMERRGNPAKMETFMAMGASLVGNQVHEISPSIAAFAHMLGDWLGGQVGTNLYCSFKGIQAFSSHYDLSEIFVIQCEGEKSWRIYDNREPDPVELPGAGQTWIDARKGKVLMEPRLRPGDLLYIPRGFYHDAIASTGASLHLTFAVNPLHGGILFSLLEEEALRDPAFRAWLPDARQDEGGLGRHLGQLGERVAALMAAPGFAQKVAERQARLRRPIHRFDLPRLPTLSWYAATGRRAEILRSDRGAILRTAAGESPLGLAGEAAAWLLTRPAFSVQELRAGFPHLPPEMLDQLVERLEAGGIVTRCAPPGR